jgi:hypothetical protein
MEITAAEERPERAGAKAALTKPRADSNSDSMSGYRGLNHYGRNHETSYLKDSCYSHVTTPAYRTASSLLCILRIFSFHWWAVVLSFVKKRCNFDTARV